MVARLKLKAGDWVEVRSKEEILATLDKRGRLDSMPFMPEMFEFCGRRMRVASSAHKSCDTITPAGGLTIDDAFHLEGARCTGKDYDGCGAGCLIFWKGAWLKPAAGPSNGTTAHPVAAPPPPATGNGCTMADVQAATRAAPAASDDSGPTYACQATELLRASKPLPWWDFRQYLEDYRTGNVGPRRILEGVAYAIPASIIRKAKHRPRIERVLIEAYDRFQSLWGGPPYPRRRGTVPPGEKTPTCKLGLQAGDLVRIKKYDEILSTLNQDFRNRGLRYDAELVPYCGGTYRVHSLVSKIIDEKTGKMLTLKTPSVILDGVVCQSRYSDRRMFCPRAIYAYWREIWLERAPDASVAAAPPPGLRAEAAPGKQHTT